MVVISVTTTSFYLKNDLRKQNLTAFFEKFYIPIIACNQKAAKSKEKQLISEEISCFLELLGGFEPPTSSLPKQPGMFPEVWRIDVPVPDNQ